MTNTFHCEKCNYSTDVKYNFDLHCTSKKHLGITNPIKEYFCKKCKYRTCNNSNFQKHLRTKKHLSDEPYHVCEVCDFCTKSKSIFKSHMKGHVDLDIVAKMCFCKTRMFRDETLWDDEKELDLERCKVSRYIQYVVLNAKVNTEMAKSALNKMIRKLEKTKKRSFRDFKDWLYFKACKRWITDGRPAY